MLSRWTYRATLALVGLVLVAPVQAQEFIHCMIQDFKRRNCWPEPFAATAQQAQREPFAIMVANGWQQQNLLAEHHFDPSSGELTEAGRLKVLWVLNECPEQHRTVFVRRGANPQQTSGRIGVVQQFLAQATYPGDPIVPVFESNRPYDGWPADRIDAVGRRYQASMPDPKLPPKDGGSSGTK